MAKKNLEKNRGAIMERRKGDRRASAIRPSFPLLTVSGRVMEDRRNHADRRVNSIRALFLDIIKGGRTS
jgi:hypothetical protein